MSDVTQTKRAVSVHPDHTIAKVSHRDVEVVVKGSTGRALPVDQSVASFGFVSRFSL